ncbi:MAG: hypothetical protein ACOC85_04975 [Thermoplasmatota archaeon]
MSNKILIIIASGDKDKAITGMAYAKNAIKRGWLEEIKVVYFGPVERLMIEDEDVRESALELSELTNPLACKAITEEGGFTEDIEELGIKAEYVGSIISDHIKDGFTPMVW